MSTPPLGEVKPGLSQMIPAIASVRIELALLAIAFTASRRLLPSLIKDLRAANCPPPTNCPPASAEARALEKASSITFSLSDS